MIVTLMACAIVIGVCITLAADALDRAAGARRLPTRFTWPGAKRQGHRLEGRDAICVLVGEGMIRISPCHRAIAFAGVALAGLAVLGCAGRRVRVEPTPDATTSFVAQGVPDPQVEGRFEGTATIRGGWIHIVVSKAQLVLPPGDRETWRNLRVRAFLAVDYNQGSWTAAVESRPVIVWRFMDWPANSPAGTRRTVPLNDTLRFLVPIPPGANLSTSRLAFETEWTFAVAGYGETDSRFAFTPLTPSRPPIH